MPDSNQLTVSSGNSIFSSIDGRKTKISSIDLLCELANNVQYLEVGIKALVKFIVKGLRGDLENVNFEVNPNGIFELTTTKWRVKAKNAKGENWRLQTYITAKKEGEANIQVIVDGKKLNTIKLTSKVLADKDVFGREAIQRLSTNVKSLGLQSSACIEVADARISELLQDQKNFMNKNRQKMSHGYYTPRIRYLEKKGFIVGGMHEFDYKKNKWTVKNSEFENHMPASLNKSIKSFIMNDINKRFGYHVYYISLLNDVHVLILIIDNTDLCNVQFEVFDQGTMWKTDTKKNINEIDNYFLESTISLYKWYKRPANNITRIAKIKKL